MEKSIINILDSNNIPLIHGPTGIGKTRLAQKIKSFYKMPYTSRQIFKAIGSYKEKS